MLLNIWSFCDAYNVIICTLSFEYIFGYIHFFQRIMLSVGYDADTVHVTQ